MTDCAKTIRAAARAISASKTLPLPSLIGLLLLFMAAGGTSGCIITDLIFGEESVDPKFDCRGQTVLVVPFRQGKQWYGDSKQGQDFARSISYSLQSRRECNDIQLAGNPELEEKIATFAGEQPPWGEFGKEAGASLVIYGEIRQLSMKQPNMIGIMQGKLDFKIHVFNVELGRNMYSYDMVVLFPKNPDEGKMSIDFEQNETQARLALYAEASNKVADLLCGYSRSKPR